MIIIWFILSYFALVAIYLLVFSIASQWKTKRNFPLNRSKQNRIAVLIPVYKSDEIILETASHALQLNYPKNSFNVIVIADSLKKETEILLIKMGCSVIRMTIQPRSKAKAINLALSILPKHYFDICLVLDADNWLSKDALHVFDQAYTSGARAMQGIRVAKSIGNPLENLEAISEGINNNLFRRGHQNLGLPAALAGSGMAFHYSLFKEIMSNIDAINGFDKDLEFEIISRGIFIHFLETALVYDEKVSSMQVLKNQRKRWFAAQIINIKKGVKFVFKYPSLSVIDKWWQMWLPSRLLLLVISAVITILLYVLELTIAAQINLLSTLVIGISLLIATPQNFFNKQLINSLTLIPASALALSWSMISFTGALKGFIHTPHTLNKKNSI